MRPRIGITTSQNRETVLGRLYNSVSLSYARGVLEAGGLPMFLPVLPGTEREQLEHLDGVLLSGGVDVDPEHFGADHEAGLGEVDPERDAFELELYRLTRNSARERNIPVLAVCRGFQLVNVAEGGTLHQHLPGTNGVWADHAQTAKPPVLSHRVRIASGSRLSNALEAAGFGPETMRVNSYHHQGVKDVAPGLTVNAWAPDGLVEGLEGPGVIALQWHPEMLFETHPEHRLPFEMLIKLCTNELAPA
jgi:putative glutamine amidotransferase